MPWICSQNNAVLIFDEVMTGFRLGLGGVQERTGVTPDLSAMGKIIGGGLPVGAFGGKTEIMNFLAPLGPVYQAGTLSGNPLAMAAGIASLKLMRETMPYERLEKLGNQLAKGVKDLANQLRQCPMNGLKNWEINSPRGSKIWPINFPSPFRFLK